MITDQLVSFVRNELNRGVAREDIVRLLMAQPKAGWKAEDIEEAIKKVEIDNVPTPSSEGSAQQPVMQHDDSPSPVFVAEPSSRNSMLVSLLVLFSVFFIGGGVLAFWYLARDNSEDPKPKVYEAISNWLNVKSYTYSGDFAVSARLSYSSALGSGQVASVAVSHLAQLFESSPEQNTSPEQISLLVTYDGVVNRSNSQKAQYGLNANIKVAIPGYGNMSANIELRSIGQRVYMRLSDLPFLGMDTSSFADKWIEINLQDIYDMVSEYDPQEARKLQEQIEQYFDSGYAGLSEPQAQEIIEVAKRLNIIDSVATLPEDSIGGTATNHYDIAINWPKLAEFYTELMSVIYDDTGADFFFIEDQTRLEVLEGLWSDIGNDFEGDVLTKIYSILAEKFDLELWVDKERVVPRQTLYRLTIDAQDISDIFVGSVQYDSGLERLTVSARTTYDNFNEPLVVQVPDESISIQALLGDSIVEMYPVNAPADAGVNDKDLVPIE